LWLIRITAAISKRRGFEAISLFPGFLRVTLDSLQHGPVQILGAVGTPCDSEKPSLQAVAMEIMPAQLNAPDLLIMFKLLHTNRAGALGKISRISSKDNFPEMEVKNFHEDLRISGTLEVNVPVIVIGTTVRITNHSIHTLRGGTC
jgi:hypothetical protein